MSAVGRLAANAASNYARFLVTMGIQLVLTPLIIKRVGVADFGLWSLTFATLGIVALLDGGLATSVVKYVAACRGSGDTPRRNRIVSTLLGLYLALALIGALVLAGGSLIGPGALGIAPERQATARALWCILGLRTVVLALPLSLFHSLLFGEQRNDLINRVQIVTTLLYGLGVWWALVWGHGGIVTVAWLNLVTLLAENGMYMVLAFRIVPDLRLTPRLADPTLLREIACFSGAQLLVNIAALVRLRTDPILVQRFFALSAVASYTVALRIAEAILLLIKQGVNLVAPLAAQWHAAGESQRLRDLLLDVTRAVFLGATVLIVALCLLARPLITVWVGPELADAAVPLIVLLTATWLAVPSMVASAILAMTGHHSLTARAQAAGVGINLAASVALAAPLGPAGIAWGTLAATALVDVGFTLPRACRLLGVPGGRYMRRALAPALTCGAVQAGVTLALPPIGLLRGLPGAVAAVALFAVAFLSVDERRAAGNWLRSRGGHE